MVSRRVSIVYEGTSRGLTSSETTMEDTHIWIMKADGTGRWELTSLDNRDIPRAIGRLQIIELRE